MRIITDSAADLTNEELRKWGVECVRTQVVIGGESYAAGQELTTEDLWTRMLAGEVAKTSQPAPGAFLEAFQAAKEAGEEALCFCVSSGVSGTIQSAHLAAAMCEWDGIHVIDTLNGTAGQKLLVMQACRLRDEGLSAAEVAAKMEKLRGRVRLLAGIETLEYLARSGRIPKALASLGTLAKLKPLLEVSPDGRLVLGGKTFGTHRAVNSLARRIAEIRIDPAYPVLPLYSCDPVNCAALVKKLEEKGVKVSGEYCAIGASIAPHIGPYAYGAAFVEAE